MHYNTQTVDNSHCYFHVFSFSINTYMIYYITFMIYYKTHPLQVYNFDFVKVIDMYKCLQNPVINFHL